MFQFIGSYDNRTMTGTIAAPDAHAMVKATSLKTSKLRKPKARSIDEIRDRAKAMGIKFVLEGKEIVLYPPKFDAKGCQDGYNHGQYWVTTKSGAWATLDEMAVEILKAKSDDQIRTEAEQALALIF